MKKIVLVVALSFFAAIASAQTAATSSSSLKKVYDEQIDPMEQIDQALVKAKQEGKFVICQLGGNWCPWCLRFAEFISKDEEIMKIIDENFIYIHVNYNPRKVKSEENAAKAKQLLKRLGNAGRFGYPVFVVLNEEGNVIHLQDSSYLEEGEGYSKKKVVSFFKHWTPSAVLGQ